jgi:hypothetical protein
LDKKLKIEAQEVSLGFRRILVELSAEIPFKRVSKYIWETQRVVISDDSTRRYTHKTGGKVESWQKKEGSVAEVLRGMANPSESKKVQDSAPEALYASADAVSVNIRGEGWKQPKVGVVFKGDKERIRQPRYIAGFWDKEGFGDGDG